MPTLSHSKPVPIFPYNLDDGYQQDCQIAPCPTSDGRWQGLFVVPIVDYWRERLVLDGRKDFIFRIEMKGIEFF
jgi:hypothetical protein